MIPTEVLFRLVPDRDPEDDYPRDPRLFDFDLNSPARRIGVWAAYLRYRIYRDMAENCLLRELVETSGFLATGIFHVPSVRDAGDYPGFDVVSGYQFGAVLLRGVLSPRIEGELYISLELGVLAYRYCKHLPALVRILPVRMAMWQPSSKTMTEKIVA